MSLEFDFKDVTKQKKKLAGWDKLSKRHFSRAMGQSVTVLLSDWKEIAPVLHGRYRGSLAGRIVQGRGNVLLEGSVGTNVTNRGFPYPAALEKSRRFHYARGPRRGQRTAGRVAGVLKGNTRRMTRFFENALDKIIKALVVK